MKSTNSTSTNTTIKRSKCCRNCDRNHQPKSCSAHEDKCELTITENLKISTAKQTIIEL